MSDRKTFEYGGYHFTPIRKFHKKEGDFFAISKRLASDPNLGLCTYQDRQKAPYDYKDFYTVSTDKECDIFRCEENGLLYVPGKNELFIYHEPKQKKRNSIADAFHSPGMLLIQPKFPAVGKAEPRKGRRYGGERIEPLGAATIRKLVTELCANYDSQDKICLPLDSPCYMLNKWWTGAYCRYFEKAVLPVDAALESAITGEDTP